MLHIQTKCLCNVVTENSHQFIREIKVTYSDFSNQSILVREDKGFVFDIALEQGY